MGQLQEIIPQLTELGYQIIAVSPDRPGLVAEHDTKKKFDYTLLSDADMSGARALGIAYVVSDQTYSTYKNRFKLDLEEHSGQTHHQLPVPAVIVIGTDGKIRFQHVDPNYRVRLHPDVLLAVAKAEASKKPTK